MNDGLEDLLFVVDASLDHLFNSENSFFRKFIDLVKLSMSKEYLSFILLEEAWFFLPTFLEYLESSSFVLTPMDHKYFFTARALEKFKANVSFASLFMKT